MATVYNKRLIKKYGEFDSMSDLMTKIIAKNSEEITKKVLKINNEVFRTERVKIRSKEKAVIMPDISDVLDPGINLRKAAERGKLMTDNLRQKLTDNLRDVLSQPDYTRHRGKMSGTMKDKLFTDFQEKIRDTFQNYVKVDPALGIPKNIKNISYTECGVVVNQTQNEFMGQLQKKNPDVLVTKIWIHRRVSKKPRKAHLEMNGMQIPFDQNFEYYNTETGNRVSTPHPHASGMLPEEVIGCACGCQYKVEKLKDIKEYQYQYGASR